MVFGFKLALILNGKIPNLSSGSLLSYRIGRFRDFFSALHIFLLSLNICEHILLNIHEHISTLVHILF